MPPSDDAPTRSLNGHPQAAPTAVAPTPPPGSTAPAGEPTDDFENWALGASPGRYQLVSFHKGGGLGQVWQAEDTVVRRTVALKCLRPDRTSPALMARFVREAQITGQLEHPNIVPLYDLFEAAGGPAYAMRFLAGDTLAAAANLYHDRRTAGTAGPLELPRLLGAFVLVCEAVAFAHSKGVLHRDLKGQNILLGHFGEVCLADWGLAKRVGDPDRPGDPSPLSPPLDAMTEPGAVMGTPAFMAPEVARKQPATPASDVYGLGAVLYQLLTNTLPHTGTTPEILSKLEAGAPVPSARALNPSLHPALDAVCRTALSREPTARYPSATALADEVRAFLAGERVAAYPEPFAARASRWVKRHRAGVLAGVVGLAVLAVASTAWGAWVWQQKEQIEAEKRKVEAAKGEAEASRDVALGLSDNLFDLVAAAETGQAPGRATVDARKQTVGRAVAAAERLATDGTGDPERLARLLWFAGNLSRLTNDRDGAEAAYRAAERVLRQLLIDDETPVRRQLLASVLDDLSLNQSLYGRLRGAINTLDVADRELAAAGTGPPARRTAALIRLQRAFVLTRLGSYDEAEAVAKRAAAEFAALDADPTGRHFLDPALHGTALLRVAEAMRERVRAFGGDKAAVVTAAGVAVAALRLAAEADAHRDVRANYYRGLVEQADARRWAGESAADTLTDLDRAVAGFAALTQADHAVAFYRQMLGTALTVRADVRAAVGEPALRGMAAIDLTRAVGVLQPMAESEAPDRPDYRATLAEAWIGLARLTRSDVQQRSYQNAAALTRGAVRLSPDDEPYRKRRDELYKEAGAAGYDVTQPQPKKAGRGG